MSPAQFFLEHPTLAYASGAAYLVGAGYVLGVLNDFESSAGVPRWVTVGLIILAAICWPAVMVAGLWIAAGKRVRK